MRISKKNDSESQIPLILFIASQKIPLTKLGHEKCWACDIFNKHDSVHTRDNLLNNVRIHHNKRETSSSYARFIKHGSIPI